MDSDICVMIELPEALHNAVVSYLDSRPDWDQDRVYKAALALFLMQQNGGADLRSPRSEAKHG